MKTSIQWYAAFLASALFLQGCSTPSRTAANLGADDSRASFEVLRSDFNTTKVDTLRRVMKLSVAEADKFWPLYRAYEKDLGDIGDRKLALIREFMSSHKAGSLDDQHAKDLADKWLVNSQDRLDLWKKYHEQISEAVSPVRAAQFLQIENQMAIFIDMNIASEAPLIRK